MDIKEREHAIRIFTLSRFNLVKEGRPVRFSRKTQQRPITLLKVLIALGGREVKEEELTNILWPETDGDSAHGAFAVNLHRLRRLVGNEKAVNFRDGKVTLNSHYCYVDAWLFERLLGKADTALKQGSKDEAIQLIEEAASLYNITIHFYMSSFLFCFSSLYLLCFWASTAFAFLLLYSLTQNLHYKVIYQKYLI